MICHNYIKNDDEYSFLFSNTIKEISMELIDDLFIVELYLGSIRIKNFKTKEIISYIGDDEQISEISNKIHNLVYSSNCVDLVDQYENSDYFLTIRRNHNLSTIIEITN